MKEFERYSDYKGHRAKLEAKHDKLEGLKALYEEWKPHLPESHEYMRELWEKIRRCETQLQNMFP